MNGRALDGPEVTWLLPVRNGMPFITQTLASIAIQSYRNWQVLAWDNGSTDGTVEELRRWIPDRLPGRVIVDRPLPLGPARARLVEEAPTEFCAWIDADDVNLPQRLERQVGFLIDHPDIAAVGSTIEVIDAEGAAVHERPVSFPLDDGAIVRHMLLGPALAQPSVLFRRSAVLAAGNYRYVGDVNVEDYDLWLRLAVDHHLANLREPLLQYRVHDRSTTVISEREGVLREAALARFVEHAPPLYGCSGKEARLLASQRHPVAILVLFRIAKKLESRSGTGRVTILRSPELIRAGRQFVASKDFVTRLALTLLARQAGTTQRAAGSLKKILTRGRRTRSA